MGEMKRREAREAQDRAAKYLDSLKLEEVRRTGLTMLEVACKFCPRHGRYKVHGLVDRYGEYVELGNLKKIIARDCPKQRVKGPMGGCGVFLPDITPERFRPR